MTAVFAFLAILLATLTGHAGSPSAVTGPGPLEHVVGHAHAPQVSPAPKRTEQVPAGPAGSGSAHVESVPQPAAVLDPEQPDYQPQQPEEVIGRQIDCPDGPVGTVVNAAGDVHCPS